MCVFVVVDIFVFIKILSVLSSVSSTGKSFTGRGSDLVRSLFLLDVTGAPVRTQAKAWACTSFVHGLSCRHLWGTLSSKRFYVALFTSDDRCDSRFVCVRLHSSRTSHASTGVQAARSRDAHVPTGNASGVHRLPTGLRLTFIKRRHATKCIKSQT